VWARSGETARQLAGETVGRLAPALLPWWTRLEDTALALAGRGLQIYLIGGFVVALRPRTVPRLLGGVLVAWLVAYGLTHSGRLESRLILEPYVLIGIAGLLARDRADTQRD
jgi:hypothetical protein